MRPWVGGSQKRSIYTKIRKEKYRNGVTYCPDVIEGVELGRKTAMNTQELLPQDSCEGKRRECLHACIIYALRILVLACADFNVRAAKSG
jgi:hypothetical protein